MTEDQMAKLTKAHQEGHMVKVDWLDRLTFREIEMSNEREKHSSNFMYPMIEFPRVKKGDQEYTIVYYEKDGDESIPIPTTDEIEKDGRSISFPARSFSSASSQPFGSPLSPALFEPAPGYIGKSATTPETPGKRLTPWEAATKSSLGFVDDAFLPQTMHESVSANVVSAARRKTLPEPPTAWKSSSTLPPTNSAYTYRSRPSITTTPQNVVPAPSMQCGYQLRYPYPSSYSMKNAGSVPLETRSEYGMSTGCNPNFNPYPRAWRS
ncbi:synaptopodin-2-like [Leptodactylus fuscus]